MTSAALAQTVPGTNSHAYAQPEAFLSAHPLTLVLALGLIVWMLATLWLTTRQMRHVAQHAGTVPPGFAAVVSSEAHRRAAQYTLAKGRLSMLAMAFNALVLLGWTLLGGLDLLSQWVGSWLPAGWPPTATGLAFGLLILAAFGLVSALLDLPWEVYRTFVMEQRFGFNRTTPATYAADLLKGTVLAVALGGPIAALMLWIMGAAGSMWWLWAWGTWMGINLLMLVLYPTVIAPLFNRFEPLQDEALAERVQRLMARCGFAARGLYVMDGSKRSAHGNAYFTGFGAARRVVFYDTLLATLSPDEIEAVLAHELGHYKMRHIAKRLFMIGLLSGVAFALLGWLSSRLWFYAALGVQPHLALPNDALALILFVLVVPVFSFWLSPLMAALSRKHEYEADAFAAREASGPALASALVKLHKDNAATLTPDPLYARFHYSHPPAAERLAALLNQPRPLEAAPA